MIKKEVKPLWSYDIGKTELWLSEMALDGYVLTQLIPQKRQFFFEKQEPKKVTYQIVHNGSASLPTALVKDGWKVCKQYGKWTILTNENAPEAIRTYPARDGIYKRNRFHFYGFGAILLLFGTSIFMQLTFLLMTLLMAPDMEVTIHKSPLWILTFIFGVLALALLVTSIVSMREIRNFEKKSSMIDIVKIPNDVKTFTKYRPTWQNSPDRLEDWLEDMALKGNQLARVKGGGPFFRFVQGQPKKIAYVADYQLKTNPDYFQFHKDNGWDHISSTHSSITKWTIWSKEYTNNQDKPRLYTEPQHILAHAKKVFFTHIGLALFLLIMNSFMLYNILSVNGLKNVNNIEIFSMTCFLLSNILVFSMGTRAGLYYSRMLKKQKN